MQRQYHLWLCLPALMCLHTAGVAQISAPGGVANPVLWQSAMHNHPGPVTWFDHLSEEDLANSSGHSADLNFNPTLVFGTGGFCQPLDRSMSNATVCIAFRPSGAATETVVWHAAHTDTSDWVLTTTHMGDMHGSHYFDLPTRESQPAQYTYLHTAEYGEGAPAIDLLCLSSTPVSPPLSLPPFQGAIAECIVYDRVLSPEERMRVESYLALKYGTMLGNGTPAVYLRSDHKVVWNDFANPAFSHRLAGIGRDDLSGLLQPRSTSSYETAGLVIEADTSAMGPIANGTFLVWGDDQGDIKTWQDMPFNEIKVLRRNWRVQITGDQQITTEVRIPASRLPMTSGANAQIYLMIDRSGKGTFAPAATEIFTATRQEDDLVFEHVRWDPDQSGDDLFRLASGNPPFVYCQVQQPRCTPPSDGLLTCKILGGTAPLSLTVTGPAGQLSTQHGLSGYQIVDVLLPQAGLYEIRTTDVNGDLCHMTCMVNDIDGPEICLEPQYYLIPGETLDLIPCASASVNYSWSRAGKRISNNSMLTISEPGDVSVTAEQGGCLTQQKVLVLPAMDLTFASCRLYPSPVGSGAWMQVDVQLREPHELIMCITDASGRPYPEQRLSSDEVFNVQAKAPVIPGIYYYHFISGDTRQSIPFVVH